MILMHGELDSHLDWDIGDNTTILKFTTEHFEGDDNRTNIGTVYCQSSSFIWL